MQLISSYFPSIMRDFSLGTVAAVDDTFHAVPTAFSPLFLNNYMIHYVWGSFARGKIHIFHIQIHTDTHIYIYISLSLPQAVNYSPPSPMLSWAFPFIWQFLVSVHAKEFKHILKGTVFRMQALRYTFSKHLTSKNPKYIIHGNVFVKKADWLKQTNYKSQLLKWS